MNYAALKAVEGLWITRDRMCGELASWAVQQSPYAVPDNLAEAITTFHKLWPCDQSIGMGEWSDMAALEDAVVATMDQVPEILAWNNRKNGRDGMGFSSRYDQPQPDDDFIDMGALARNIAMGAWADAVAFKGFNDKFEAEHGPLSVASAIDARSAETAQQAQPEGQVSGPQGGAQPLHP